MAEALAASNLLSLQDAQVHYFKTVLRRQAGAQVRVFNGADGEFLATLAFSGKKGGSLTIETPLRPQPPAPPPRALYFALPKKKAFDLLIEKSVELGVTHLHPLSTARTQIHKLDQGRVQAQIVEACEQSERLDIPAFMPLASLKALLAAPPVKLIAAVELIPAPLLGVVIEASDPQAPLAFLTGPEGGFTDEERALISHTKDVQLVSLGDAILKVETAVMLCLSAAKLRGHRSGLM